MPRTDTPPDHGQLGAALISVVAAESKEQLCSELDELFRVRATTEGNIALRLAELERRQAFRDEGATSIEKWTTERYGISSAAARALSRCGEKGWDLPHLIGAVHAGDISFDKLRAVSGVATSETDEGLKEQAERCTVRELADVARTMAASHSPTSDHDRRFVRFNDTFRTMTAQLPQAAYAEVRTTLESAAPRRPHRRRDALGSARLRRLDRHRRLVERWGINGQPELRGRTRPTPCAGRRHGRSHRTRRGPRAGRPDRRRDRAAAGV